MILFVRSLCLLLAIAFATPALAGWIVSKVSQPATFAVDGRTWRAVRQGMELPNHAWVHTGRRGRVILQRGADTIQFKPNSVAAVSVRNRGGNSETTVIQKFGSILLEVDPTMERDASVQTPYMAAIVKGTLFEVVVRMDGAELRVRRGLVEVIDLVDGFRVDVSAGQSVEVAAVGDGPPIVRGRGPRSPVVAVDPPPAIVAPARPAVPARADAGGAGALEYRGESGDGDEDVPIGERVERVRDIVGREDDAGEEPAAPEPSDPPADPAPDPPSEPPAPEPGETPEQVPDPPGENGGGNDGEDPGGMPEIPDVQGPDEGEGPIDGN